MKYILRLVFTVLLVLWVTSVPVRAAPLVSLSAYSGEVGTPLYVTGTGFTASVPFRTHFGFGTFYVVVRTGTVSASGTIYDAFAVPEVPGGSYTVYVETSGTEFASSMFTVLPSVRPNKTSVVVGEGLVVSGTGLGASRTITISVDTVTVATAATNANGSFTGATFPVPETYRGSHRVSVTDNINSASTGIDVRQSAALSPNSGAIGSTVKISGTGFRASQTITIAYDGVVVTTSPAPVVTSAVGSFSTSFTVPPGLPGPHPVTASDGVDTASASFTSTVGMSLTPLTGKVGTQATVSGSGFGAGKPIIVRFDTFQVGTTTTDASGNFTTSFPVPPSFAGAHPVTASDGVDTASATFTSMADMSLTPITGKVGTQATVSGSGFGAGKPIIVRFDTFQVGTTTTDANGSFSSSYPVPPSFAGAHPVTASDGTNTTSASFNTTASVSLNLTKGQIGDEVAVSGTGFSASRQVVITFAKEQVKTSTTDASGSFSDKFIVPRYTAGSYDVSASDGINTPTAGFTITVSASLSSTTGNVGSTLTISGGGFTGSVTIKYDATVVATVTAEANGTFSASFNVPPSIRGDHLVSASDGLNMVQTTFIMESVPPPVPAPLLPATGTKVNQQPSFEWQSVTDPSGVTYTLQIGANADFTTMILQKQGLEATKYTLTGAEKLPSTKKESPYYWRVKAVDGATNESAWALPISFQVSFFPDWAKNTLMGMGAVVVVLFTFWLGFWLGRRSAYA